MEYQKKGSERRPARIIGLIIMTVLAIVCVVYGMSVFSILGPGNWFNYIWFIGGAVLLLLGLLFFGKLRIHWSIKAIVASVIAVCLVNFGIFEVRTVRSALKVPDNDTKWVIVLGAKVNGSTPSVEFNSRIKAAADYIKTSDTARGTSSKAYPGPIATVITTGGQGQDEGAAEGDVCARVLQGLGVDSSRILIENKSTTTQEKLMFAREIIETNGGSMQDKVVIVSSEFHLYRALRLAEACGYTNAQGLGSRGLAVLVPHYYVREYAAYVKEATMGHFR